MCKANCNGVGVDQLGCGAQVSRMVLRKVTEWVVIFRCVMRLNGSPCQAEHCRLITIIILHRVIHIRFSLFSLYGLDLRYNHTASGNTRLTGEIYAIVFLATLTHTSRDSLIRAFDLTLKQFDSFQSNNAAEDACVSKTHKDIERLYLTKSTTNNYCSSKGFSDDTFASSLKTRSSNH